MYRRGRREKQIMVKAKSKSKAINHGEHGGHGERQEQGAEQDQKQNRSLAKHAKDAEKGKGNNL